MKKLFLLLILPALLSSCIITSEDFRYKERFDDFYNVLTEDQKLLFAEGNLSALGASIDESVNTDFDYATALEEVKITESIMTFDGVDTATYFYEIILREIHRDYYYELMEFFDSSMQNLFVFDIDTCVDRALAMETEDNKFARFLDHLKSEGRLYGFSTEEVIRFLRDISFSELSQKQVYYLLDFLNDQGYYSSFIGGNISGVANGLTEDFSTISGNGIKKKYNKIVDLAGLDELGVEEFLTAYFEVVMVEMDSSALQKTLEHF